MGSWVYGMCEVERNENGQKWKELVVSEVYFNENKKPHMFNPVDWEQLYTKKEREWLAKDLTGQLKRNIRFIVKFNKKGGYKIEIKRR